MSYILEALKKADRERAAGHVPDLDTVHRHELDPGLEAVGHRLPVSLYRGHRARLCARRLHDEAPPGLGKSDQGFFAEGPCRSEGRVIPITVPGQKVRFQAQTPQQTEHGGAGHAYRRLCNIGLRERLLLRALFLRAEALRREDVTAQRLVQTLRKDLIPQLERVAHLRKLKREITQHMGILRSLTGK